MTTDTNKLGRAFWWIGNIIVFYYFVQPLLPFNAPTIALSTVVLGLYIVAVEDS